ncbi:MAG: hypothetical protein K0S38_625 [Candidatus Paceibacter sp.]|jgi:hypothetical protein|nr:hypothetical protein [Candidatus Paceibacter sp.]
MKLHKSVVGFVGALVFFQPLLLLACGVSIINSNNGFDYGNDSAEQSFINYENGTEKLIISRDFTNGSKDTVWVIPIPSDPQQVNVDVIADIPQFTGSDVEQEAAENMITIRDGMIATQIYPVLGLFVLSPTFDTSRSAGPSKGARIPQFGGGSNSDVTVFSTIEKEGMIAEVLSAKNSDALYTYLTEKGLNVEKNSISILQDYIGKDFSFVASWISPSAKAGARKGLVMTFPTDKIFYPLKPGSVYPGEGLPETITVIGHVSPKIYTDIKAATEVHYYETWGGIFSKDFYTSDRPVPYTKIVISASPKALTQDLYISPTAPLRISHATFINHNPLLYGIIVYLITVILTTYFTVKLLSLKISKSQFIDLTVLNTLTIIGTIVGSRRSLKEKKWKYVLTFTVLFVILTLAFWAVMNYIYA